MRRSEIRSQLVGPWALVFAPQQNLFRVYPRSLPEVVKISIRQEANGDSRTWQRFFRGASRGSRTIIVVLRIERRPHKLSSEASWRDGNLVI